MNGLAWLSTDTCLDAKGHYSGHFRSFGVGVVNEVGEDFASNRLCLGELSSIVWNAWFGSLGVMEKAPFRDGRAQGAVHDPKAYTP